MLLLKNMRIIRLMVVSMENGKRSPKQENQETNPILKGVRLGFC